MALSMAEAEAQALEMQELRLMAELINGGTPGLTASMLKIRGTELSQRLTEIGLDIAGHYTMPFQAHLTAPGGPILNRSATSGPPIGPEAFVTTTAKYLNDRVGSIYAGSNEIQRNILSKVLLS